MNGVVLDLAPHPAVQYAVIVDGELLPVRFARRSEAVTHFGQIVVARDAAQESRGGAAA